ncbi:XRE family transcriptional regulator [Eubacterium callanderi]|uniref:XRE family transcriptional regulator n=1 Tax=Eubacterium callanderi TaxID=53442 RepID=UPI001D13C93F|nr:XRE family transcriptional regulator [Eubacterium callanderi]MCC3401071.1 LexA family transcriptional regulator [Eubacterium callanderi]
MSGLGNKQIMAKNIQYYMDFYNKSRKEICEAIGVKYTTFTDWVKGNSYPRIDKIEMMANYFGIEKSDLIEEKSEKDVPISLFTEEEISHLENYRKLDDYGRKTIDLILERELDRYKQFQQLQNKTANLTVIEGDDEPAEDYGENVVMMPTLMQKLCAGTGSVGDDVQLENEPYPAIRVPAGSKYAATVAGDSMEPEYSDGDVVFFNDTNTPRFGDIVVLSINKENYLKKYTERGFEALNPKYDILVPGESDFVVVFGKVLGKL